MVHQFTENDSDQKTQFCETISPLQSPNICCSDECSFLLPGKIIVIGVTLILTLSGNLILNIQKNLTFGKEYWLFTEQNLIEEVHLYKLQTTFGTLNTEIVEKIPNEFDIDILFQHDGEPPRSSRQVRNSLDNNFSGCWICFRGPTGLPARLPDMTPL